MSASSTRELADRLRHLERLARVHDRDDLAERAVSEIDNLTRGEFRVIVMGEFKKGKTSLVNSLFGVGLGRVDDDIATSAPVEVRYGDEPAVRVWRRADGSVLEERISLGEAASRSADTATVSMQVCLPNPMLRAGLVVVDTPGIGGLESAAAVITASTLADAHAALFVTDTSQGLTDAELRAVGDAVQRCGRVVVVETKTDVHPHWRQILEEDRTVLADAGLDVGVVAVSSQLRSMALADADQDLNTESGFPDLIDVLTGSFLASAESIVRAGAERAVARIHAHLRQPLAHELETLEAADGGRESLDDANAAVAALRDRAASWPQILNDGMVDVTAEIEVHLKDEFRRLVAETEDLIDESDPDAIRAELEPDVERRAAEIVDANLTLLRDGVAAVAQRLADALDAEDITGIMSGELHGQDDEPTTDAAIRNQAGERRSVGTRVQQAFRAGYGGAMPIMALGGMALGVLGLGTFVLPLAGVAGAAAGRRALRDERDRHLRQRRQETKTAVRKYVEETTFRVSNERKAMQRRLQRSLRDHCASRVKEIATTHRQIVERAQSAAESDRDTRRRRAADLQQEIGRIDAAAGFTMSAHR